MPIIRSFFPLLGAVLLASSLQARAGDIAQAHGMAADGAAAQRTVKIDAGRKYINVQRGEVVRFVTDQGSFAWSFDTARTVAVFDFARIAPPGVDARDIKVYVADAADQG